ncbi:conserved hypothetical protein [Ricinus communis]|uniref:Uncharacterized protein n=1 Tax=Ricinus communis TaxID=3988 RepID=B9S8U4_RICCO|nr:conserved hypothetical protein [Ricinus communis]
MQRKRERRDDFFGMADPFGNFGGFDMRPSLFGGRNPFDDPFFTRPFRSMFQSSNSATSDVSQTTGAKGIVIEELNSDYESEKEKETDTGLENEPSVEHPDDGFDAIVTGLAEEKSKTVNHGSDYNRIEGNKSQARSFSFQTCKVTYGGVDGAYYTCTRTRRAGNDGE